MSITLFKKKTNLKHGPLLFLLFTLSLCNVPKKPWELRKCRVDDSLIKTMNPSQVADGDPNSPEYKRRLSDIKLDKEGFKNFSIYLDLVNIEKEIEEYGLQSSKNIFIDGMQKAVNTLQSLLKVKLTQNYVFYDETIESVGVKYWNKNLIGTEMRNKRIGIQNLGIDLYIVGRFLNDT